MQTGFTDYLNHLNTKFIARRSDIIVNSTLSVTLTPTGDDFEPTAFALVGVDEIWDYVMLRQEYRAHHIQSNSLDHKFKQYDDNSCYSENSEDSDLAMPEPGSFGSFLEDGQVNEGKDVSSEKIASMSRKKFIPPTLLNEPIKNPKQVLQLNTKEKRLYNIQKQKWEQ